MVTTTDTQRITITSTGRTARTVAIVAGLASSFLTGVLAATGAADYGIGLTRVGWDLARATAISCAIVAVVAAMSWWAVEQLVCRIGPQLDRNRNATLALTQQLDQLDLSAAERDAAGRSVSAMALELARMRGRLDATLMEQNELLHRLAQRLAVDVGIAYELGAESTRD